MGWESSDVFRFGPTPPSRSNDGSLALVSCLFGGYKFASVLRCVGLILLIVMVDNKLKIALVKYIFKLYH